MTKGSELPATARGRTIDARVLGLRIKSARQAAGLTQQQVAHPFTSTGYLSRVEAGQRRPSSGLLAQICRNLGISVSALVMESPDEPLVEQWVRLSHAEWHLARGRLEEAQTLAEQIALEAVASGLHDLAAQARTVQAHATLNAGKPEQAASLLEEVLTGNHHAAASIRAHALLCTASTRLGDLYRALEVGRRGRELVERFDAHELPESLRLAAAYAVAASRLGQNAAAQRICTDALGHAARTEADRADHLQDSYWRTSLNETAQGIYADAWRHAESAVGIGQLRSFQTAIADLQDLNEELRQTRGL